MDTYASDRTCLNCKHHADSIDSAPSICWSCSSSSMRGGRELPAWEFRAEVSTTPQGLLRQKLEELEITKKTEKPVVITRKPQDAVNHPKHYTQHPSGVEAIQVTEHMNFCLGNAMKYIWRAGLKGDEMEDLKKAAWYINREIDRRTKEKANV